MQINPLRNYYNTRRTTFTSNVHMDYNTARNYSSNKKFQNQVKMLQGNGYNDIVFLKIHYEWGFDNVEMTVVERKRRKQYSGSYSKNYLNNGDKNVLDLVSLYNYIKKVRMEESGQMQTVSSCLFLHKK